MILTREIVERLGEFEQNMRSAVGANFVNMRGSDFLRYARIYEEITGEKLTPGKLSCNTCRLAALKKLWGPYTESKEFYSELDKKAAEDLGVGVENTEFADDVDNSGEIVENQEVNDVVGKINEDENDVVGEKSEEVVENQGVEGESVESGELQSASSDPVENIESQPKKKAGRPRKIDLDAE